MRRAGLVFLFSFILVVSRRPDVLFHAQFWAEDGKFWYADAYNLGAVQPFLHPAVGYFQTLPRLAALIALAVPLSTAPLLLNCLGILFQILPVQFLLSSRCRELGSFAARSLFAFLYLGLPNSHEVHVNITNAQWRLALLAMLIIFALPGRTVLWNAFDFCLLALSALTGPFIIFIAPIAAVFFLFEKRDSWRLSLLLTTGIGAVIQGISVLTTGASTRMIHEFRGASLELLVRILAKQDFLAVLFGRRTLGRFSFDSTLGMTIAIVAVLAGLAIELYVLLKAPLPWKVFIIFSTCILAVSLASPMTTSPQWPALLASGGVRYWFFSMLAFVASIIWMLNGKSPAFVRRTAATLLVVMVFGVIQDWGNPRPVDLHFPEYAKKFSELPAGTSFNIPLNPVGLFIMTLTKR